MTDQTYLYRCEIEQCGAEKRSRTKLAVYGTCKDCETGFMRRVTVEQQKKEERDFDRSIDFAIGIIEGRRR